MPFIAEKHIIAEDITFGAFSSSYRIGLKPYIALYHGADVTWGTPIWMAEPPVLEAGIWKLI